MTPVSPAAPLAPGTSVAPAQRRLAAFCSAAHPEIFHAIVHHQEIWKQDPCDVESIHDEARLAFRRLLDRAVAPERPPSGRLLLLLGESGSGKTHLMRAFRNTVHEGELGYCGYLQMTSRTQHYDRYVLNNLIESLDHPYLEPEIPATGLMRLSQSLLDALPPGAPERTQLREAQPTPADLERLIVSTADLVRNDARLAQSDLDLIRVLLYLQCDDPRLKSRALKYLRCEDLAPLDRELLGHIVPRHQEGDALTMIARLGQLMAALHGMALVLLVDQLEDMTDQEVTGAEAAQRFRRAMDVLCAIADQVPSAVLVVACLEDYFVAQKPHLPRPKLDRIEKDPEPVRLAAQRDPDEVEELVSRRLQFLYDQLAVPYDEQQPTAPYTALQLQPLVSLRTRDVLDHCRVHRERCLHAGAWQAPTWEKINPPPPPVFTTQELERAWNDFRAAGTEAVPDDEESLAELLGWAIARCSDELPPDHWFATEPDGRSIPVEIHGPNNTVERLLVTLCDKGPQRGALGKQIQEAVKAAGGHRLVIARSAGFPKAAGSPVLKQLGEIKKQGGQGVVVEDSDWRLMQALRAFRQHQEKRPEFNGWLQATKPLSSLPSLQHILKLKDILTKPVPPPVPPPSVPPAGKPAVVEKITPVPPPPPPAESGPLLLGQKRSLDAAPLTLAVADLTRHAAFLGSSGSGKTTIALNLIEQLLLRGIPAVLVDRKGDLCGYAHASMWTEPLPDAAAEQRRQQLRERVEVQVYTPGHPAGRPLSIPIAPDGMDKLPAHDRAQLAGFAAGALASMMGYKPRGLDKARLGILRQALELLGARPNCQLTLPRLIDFIGGEDDTLLQAVGAIDIKQFKRLAQDLQTILLNHKQLLERTGPQLSLDELLGKGTAAQPGRTRLSIISTKFLGDVVNQEFWVAQFLVEIMRWGNRQPSAQLQAVFLFDEADVYLPASRQPATKAPMENLLKRARSAGLGILLATQSPGDLDYKCRENVGTWLAGRITQDTALAKMKPLLSDYPGDLAGKLPKQQQGQFILIRDRDVQSLQARRSLLRTEQFAEDQILDLARPKQA